MSREVRLPAVPTFRMLKGWAGSTILRPCFDSLALRAVAQWYLRLSRAWAAADTADGDVDLFIAMMQSRPRNIAKIIPAIERVTQARRKYEDAENSWRRTFFQNSVVSASTLIECETHRFEAATQYMNARRGFLPYRRSFNQVDWSIAKPGEVVLAQGARLENPEMAFNPSGPSSLVMSKLVPGNKGNEAWLRMHLPTLANNDTAWAHVFWPQEKPRGVIISLHGVLMEQDMWHMADPVSQLVECGFCVIRPEGPWHGRRCPRGSYGGEAIFAKGILGFIELFQTWVVETAHWIRWARLEMKVPIGLAGISLGALTAQLVVDRCGNWPSEMKPDAALLITTTGDMSEGALSGGLAEQLSIRRRLLDAGWNRDEIIRWRSLLEPSAHPALDAKKITMVLGDADTVTPYHGGAKLAERWRLPSDNIMVRHQGHFSTTLGLYNRCSPLERFAEMLGE